MGILTAVPNAGAEMFIGVGHAGVSPIVSQTTLTLLLVVLGLSIVAFSLGLVRSAESLRMHRFIMSAAVVLFLIPVFLVMLPATYGFYTDPDVALYSPLSIMTVIHGLVGLPVVVLGLVFLSNDLPGDVKRWMRRTSLLMLAAIGLGVLLFLTMLGLVGFGAGM